MHDPAAPSSFVDSASETRIGRFVFRVADESWTWSDGTFRIHGFEPGEVVPTTELVMRHIHPDDVASAHAARVSALEHREPFTFPHRIVDATGRLRVVIAAGHAEHEDDGDVLVGHLLDVTGLRHDAVDAELSSAVREFTASRAPIEQAKGVLMQLYSVDAETAWQMLRAYSQHRNRKVRDLAATLLEAAASGRTPSKDQVSAVHEVLDALVTG